MEKLSDEQLLSIVSSEFETAMGSDGGEISLERARAFDFYLRKPFGNEVEGESKVVTSDVADAVNGIMPSLLRMFTTQDNLVSLDPVGAEDVDQAAQESEYVNYVFFKKNPSFPILYNWFFDALVQKNGVVMAWWDVSERVTEENYTNKTIEELTPLLDDAELEPIEREEFIDNETGQVLHNIKFRRVTKSGQVRVENVPVEEYRISSDARALDPSQARMVGRERHVSRSDLVDMGFDKKLVYGLPAGSNEVRVGEDQSRRNKTDDQIGKAHDKAMEKVLVREAYIYVDFDGDGRAELRQVFTGGGRLLKWADGRVANEVVDRQPFHVICPRPLPHKHFGLSTAEDVMDIQEVTSTLLRQTLNNLYQSNNPRHGISEMGMSENTLDDLLTNRAGGIVRFAGSPQQSWTPMTVPFTAGSSFPMVQYFDEVKRDRVGISSNAEGLSPESLKNIQQSVMNSSLDIGKMKVEAVARIFSETGIKTLFLHIHELVRKHCEAKEIVLLRNRFVPVDPREWRTRYNVTVNVGLGIGTRQQNLMDLEAIWQKQVQIWEGGGRNLVVQPKHLYATFAEIVRNTMKNPAMFAQDPGDEMAPPPEDEMMQMQQMQMQIEQRRQELDAAKQEIAQAKLALETEKAAVSHMREEFKLMMEREQSEQKLAMEAAKLQTDGELAAADVMLKKAQAMKVLAEAQAQDLENDAAESGLIDLVDNLGR
jgi:hypothetical protein